MAREVIIKVLDDDELKPQFSQDGNVYRATLPSPYENMGELIRCKDCRWWSGKKEYRDYPMCIDHMRMMNADDYCSRAEKRKIE